MNKEEIQAINGITEAISSVIRGEIPQKLDLKEQDNHKIKELVSTTNLLIESFGEANDFIASLAQGKLNIEIPVRNNLVSQFKQLHSNLRHLTWQVRQVAMGDYSQRVDFLGDFSDYFNSMITSLKEKKNLEKTLLENKRFLGDVLDSIQDGISVLDPEQNIVLVNQTMRDWYAHTLPLEGKKCYEAYHSESKPCEVCPTIQAMKTERPEMNEIPLTQADGVTGTLELFAFPMLNESGRVTGVIEYVRDISKRKRMEEELLKAKKLESVGILAGGIAHDFNNLLSVIAGNLELAKDDISSEVEALKFLKEAAKASLQAQELTKQLITFAKGGAPVKRIGSIGDLVKETTNFVLAGSRVKCDFLLSDDLWLVEFDGGQLKHAMKNVVDNAVEAMPDGGLIEVRAENSEIKLETIEQGLTLQAGKYVKISIRDYGVGIPEEHLPQIFDPYFSNKDMWTQKGMGLGLATTYSIINQHNGRIAVESEVGTGTTLTLYLPAHEKEIRELKPVETIKPVKPPMRTGKILVMDDEELIRDLVKHMLSRFGYDAELSQDGAEAIELYKRAADLGKPYDAVILDLTVKGGMGGKDAVKRLLAIDPQVKAIVSSGYSNDPVMTDFGRYGFIGALSKPYTMNDLMDALDKVTTA